MSLALNQGWILKGNLRKVAIGKILMPEPCKDLVSAWRDIYETFCESKGTNKACDFYDDEDSEEWSI